MKKKILAIILVLSLVWMASCSLIGCEQGGVSADLGKLSISKINCAVGEKVEIKVRNLKDGETIEYSFLGDDIYIADGKVEGMLANTAVTVKATSSLGRQGDFKVEVDDDNYVSSKAAVEQSEGWFDDIAVEKVEDLSEDFPMGVDLSTMYEVLANGGKFYNSEGKRQNPYQILKDSGVNYVRLRLWNDPYNTFSQNGQTVNVTYGGGICDYERVVVMAADAKRVGLKVLLDFHYSDFWAHPGQQVIPKAWKDLTTADAIADAIYDYTYETIQNMDEAGAMPDMVQIGNEITSGMILQYPGGVNTSLTGDNGPDYISDKTNLSSILRGTGTNLVKYIKAGNDAVKDYNEYILTVVHVAKGMSDTGFYTSFYNNLSDVDFDIIGASFYMYWQGSVPQLTSNLSHLKREFPDKLVALMEVSYGFTYEPNSNANLLFKASNTTSGEGPRYGYEVSVQGQADYLRDTIAALVGAGNGYGLFWWEGAWIPVSGVGWADASTKNSWANQALFSYDGKALSSLQTFALVR